MSFHGCHLILPDSKSGDGIYSIVNISGGSEKFVQVRIAIDRLILG
jgi:hypothetical protein